MPSISYCINGLTPLSPVLSPELQRRYSWPEVNPVTFDPISGSRKSGYEDNYALTIIYQLEVDFCCFGLVLSLSDEMRGRRDEPLIAPEMEQSNSNSLPFLFFETR